MLARVFRKAEQLSNIATLWSGFEGAGSTCGRTSRMHFVFVILVEGVCSIMPRLQRTKVTFTAAFLPWDGNQCVIDIKSWPTTSTPTASSPTASAFAMSPKGSSATHQHNTEERIKTINNI